MRRETCIIPLLIILICGLCLIGCVRQTAVSGALETAENVMDDKPDSALVLLKGIDVSELSGNEQNARYALLLSQAKDKCYDYTSDDSLISIALDYYAPKNDTRRKMLSLYYYARVKYNAKDYNASMDAFQKAYDYAKDLQDNFWMGMSCRGISDIYDETFNRAEALDYTKKSYEYFKKSGKKRHADYAALEVAGCSTNFGDLDGSQKICHEMLRELDPSEEPYLVEEFKRTMALNYTRNGEYDKSLKLQKEICTDALANETDSAYLCLSYIDNKEIDQAYAIYQKLNVQDSMMNYFLTYRVGYARGKIDEALKALESTDSIITLTLRRQVSRSAALSTLNHLEEKKREAETELLYFRWALCLSIVSAAMLMVIIILLFARYKKRKESEMGRQIALAEELRDKLASARSQFNNAKSDISSLIQTRYKTLDELSKIVFSTSSNVANRQIASSVNSLIAQMKTGGSLIKELEQSVNDYCDNIMAELRRELPDLPDLYYRFFLFSVLGFSDSAKALFLGKAKVSMIWDMRRHLKDKLKKMESPNKEDFLNFL